MSIYRIAEEKFGILDYTPVGICVTTSEHIVLFWNRYLADWTGISKSDIVGKKLELHFPNLSEPRYLERLETIFNGGPPAIFSSQLHKYIFSAKLPNGEMQIQHTTVTGIPYGDGEHCYALWAVEDVTELARRIQKFKHMRDRVVEEMKRSKQMEEELLKAKKLESIGILAGGIAHDFNNLLSIIMGNIHLAMDEDGLGDDISEALAEAEKASVRAANLTKQLITFSKGGEPITKSCHIPSLLTEMTKVAVAGSNVEYNFFLQDDLWPVDIDKGQIEHVIRNIVMNAVQSMSEGGIVEVRAENFLVSSEKNSNVLSIDDGEYVKIAIHDHGSGIPKQNIERIFDPYFSTRERGIQKGMGLGLTISYSIIKKHGGTIAVKSKTGAGTSVYIYLRTGGKISQLKTAIY
ncbi:ATP-binding protein [Desulfobacterales bacterium HSG16]|nr:ATP-binding protein [Desulfobacterales bacterium HSG16]